MYCDFFGFKEFPFAITPNPRFIYLSKNHREAFAHLLYGIDNHAGFIEITGEVGSGKTTILRALLGQLDDEKYRSAFVFNPRLSSEELLRTINREFGIPATGSIDELIHALNQFLLQENSVNRTVVLVIDEAQNLDPAVLEQIRMISNLETNTDKLIQIVLAGQPELGKMLEAENLRQLNQRITVRFHLSPLDFDDMCSYIDHRLEIAGGWRAVTFSRGALQRIFKHSKGLPRLVNVVTDRSLLIGYTEESREISSIHVKQAIKEVKRENMPAPMRPYLFRALATLCIVILVITVGLIAKRSLSPNRGTAPKSAAETVPNTKETEIIGNLVIELGKSSEMKSALDSFNVLAKIWNVRHVVSYGGKTVARGLVTIGARRGLSILTYSGSLEELLQYGTPCILELRLPGIQENRYIALTGNNNGILSVGSAAISSLTLNATQLKTIWTGRAYVPWRNTFKISGKISPNTNSPEIKYLQQMLIKVGIFAGKATGTFDTSTKEAIIKFQESQKLPVNGKPDPRTVMVLYRVSGTTSEPKLTGHERS